MIQMTCYELAKNPDVQQKLHEEIDSVASTLDGKSVNYEQLHKMPYLDMIISEGLRKWPPAVQTDRICLKDYKLDLGNGKTITIHKNQNIIIPVFLLQRDPAYFPDPERFDPSRFSDENKDSIVPGTYIPFGLGPRTCIGSRFALMEGKLLLFNLLKKFTLETCDKTPEKITHQANLIAGINETIFLKFTLRK